MAIIGQKKPHPFSKEGRALREQEALKSNVTPEATQQQPVEKQPADDGLKAILARLEKLEEENKALKGNDPLTIARMKKEIYKGPRNYAFSLWGGIPVLSRTSYRLDPTKDWEYKNQYGIFETNHYMKLELANGEFIDGITNYNFLRDRQKSEPLKCKVVSDEEGNTIYDFGQYGDYKVQILSSKFIN